MNVKILIEPSKFGYYDFLVIVIAQRQSPNDFHMGQLTPTSSLIFTYGLYTYTLVRVLHTGFNNFDFSVGVSILRSLIGMANIT